MYHTLFTHSPVNTWVPFNFWPQCIMLRSNMFESLFVPLQGIYPEIELLDHMASLFNFLRNCHIVFPQQLHIHCIFPTSNKSVFQFPHILVNTSNFFYNSHSKWCKAVSRHFDLHFPNDQMLRISMCLLVICRPSLKKCLRESFAHFNQAAFLLSYGSSLYILEINPLTLIF